ncbi:hypothetical protein PGT21_018150 [Puccinia graminis f. sp. tritici]|uniref:Uncharacterized protein n=1 Tax=Puccinia graminis f. sp. tritici TaxID=56615 RepID=A0A5B0Q5Z4_PUCGR|nr:hypothetical protein PGT21_018150 [Puccinia graminis f. sp. tritici]
MYISRYDPPAQLQAPQHQELSQPNQLGQSMMKLGNRPDLADSRYKRNKQGAHLSCTSSPDTNPANMTHSSTSSTSSNSSVDVPDNQELLLPGLWASKRSSSMAIKANLKELEQALVSLLPRALRCKAQKCL